MPTKIAWTDESWNPVTGCTPVSEGCKFCYAKRMTERFGGDFSKVTLHPDRLEIPLHWRRPRMVFVPSMGDLFHEDVPDEFIVDVFATMYQASQHTFQLLTKRPERMRAFAAEMCRRGVLPWTPNNVWLGVSVENQVRADERIPLLLDTPAAVRFVSAEPLLGELHLETPLRRRCRCGHRVETHAYRERCSACQCLGYDDERPCLDWVIVGGESGGPPERRLVERCKHETEPAVDHLCVGCLECGGGWRPKPEALEWVRDIIRQCEAAGVPCFFKQWGPKAGQGTLVDGREHREMSRC